MNGWFFSPENVTEKLAVARLQEIVTIIGKVLLGTHLRVNLSLLSKSKLVLSIFIISLGTKSISKIAPFTIVTLSLQMALFMWVFWVSLDTRCWDIIFLYSQRDIFCRKHVAQYHTAHLLSIAILWKQATSWWLTVFLTKISRKDCFTWINTSELCYHKSLITHVVWEGFWTVCSFSRRWILAGGTLLFFISLQISIQFCTLLCRGHCFERRWIDTSFAPFQRLWRYAYRCF